MVIKPNTKEGVIIMITKKDTFAQLPKELERRFSELNIGKHLRKARITKGFGYSCLSIFRLIFLLVFQYKNWFQALQSKKAVDLPKKDTIYRFLNSSTYAWRTFLLSLCQDLTGRIKKLTSNNRVKVFIVDDSLFSRNRSKSVELLSRVFDHTEKRFYKGFQLLTLGWSDGYSFLPVDFALLSSAKKENQLNGVDESIDKRTSGYKRRLEAQQDKPSVVSALLDHALNAGITADYVLMDTWFTHEPLIEKITDKGLFVIGMVKQLKQRYFIDGEAHTLDELFKKAKRTMEKKDLLGSIHVHLAKGRQVKIVFVRNRNKKSEWLAILSTDTTLSDEEIVRIYGMRWDIETFFKCTKSLLNLAKEFQGRSYDLLISHTTIVFTRFILLEWERRQNNDPKTIGNLFFLLCEDVKDMDLESALNQLLAIFQTLAEANVCLNMELFKSKVQEWIASLPNYIKRCLTISVCES